MTRISREEVQHLAQLSGLRLPENETDALQAELENILKYVEQLNELDTTGVEPTYQTTGLQNVQRDDVVVEDRISREQLLVLSPEAANDQVKVPKVL